MSDHDHGEHVKEVYARFGVAVYCAQVLEHGLVNALVILDLIPSRRNLARSRDEWGAEVDTFMDRHFEETMGRMMKNLRDVTPVDTELENLLRDASTSETGLSTTSFVNERQSSCPREAVIKCFVKSMSAGTFSRLLTSALKVLLRHFVRRQGSPTSYSTVSIVACR
jgi:hypothetical protein